MIRRLLRRWLTARPATFVSVTSLTTLAHADGYRQPTPEPYIPMTEAERIAAGDIARAERAAVIAGQVRVNPLADPPEVCAARAADPAWQAEQGLKREAASEAFVRYRNEDSGLPLVVKGRY